jgi:hypothetical protein
LKRYRVGVAAFLTVVAASCLLWLGPRIIRPSVVPEDIEVRATLLQPSQLSGRILDTAAEWVVEIEVFNKNSKRLVGEEYCNIIYAYVENYRDAFWDFPEEEEDQYAAANGSRAQEIVGKELSKLLRGSYNEDQVRQDMGYYYRGESGQPSSKARFYLISPNDVPPDLSRSFVFYTHIESKWGQELTWTRSFPVETAGGQE